MPKYLTSLPVSFNYTDRHRNTWKVVVVDFRAPYGYVCRIQPLHYLQGPAIGLSANSYRIAVWPRKTIIPKLKRHLAKESPNHV